MRSAVVVVGELATMDGWSPFDRIKHTRLDGSEFWLGRELQVLVTYVRWEDFKSVIVKARNSASANGEAIDQHFVLVEYTVEGKRGGSRLVQDYELSRHGAYLAAMNADENKPAVAAAQAYFARQTNDAEVMKADLASMPADIQQQIAILLRQGRLENEQRRQGAQLVAHGADIQRLTSELHEAREALEQANHRIEAVETDDGWITGRSYAIRHGLVTNDKYIAQVSRRARTIAAAGRHGEPGFGPGEAPHKVHGTVKTYPEWVWAAAFPLVDPTRYIESNVGAA
ncbi:hypothetical protein ABZ863_01790 [Saccharomonospora sp. NPDC046836]|uniref:hypothetical protein n=1 Tax=Saccharomonospora sp. NPDC046836 TaxID=3156921 RepID=UPI0033FC81AC